MTTAPQPSPALLAVARARAQLQAAAAEVSPLIVIDSVRYMAIGTRLAEPLFNPDLDHTDLTAADLWGEEAVRLVENVVASLSRLHRHLGTPLG